MRKTILFVVLILLLAAVMPAQAYWKEVQGERIHLSPGEQTYPANTPFFLACGWNTDKSLPGRGDTFGLYEFKLVMDDKIPVQADFVYHWGWGNPPEDDFPGQKMDFGKLWVYNFPEGMTGVHTFEGFWYTPCMDLDGPQNCSQPTELVQTYTSQTTVTFTEGPP